MSVSDIVKFTLSVTERAIVREDQPCWVDFALKAEERTVFACWACFVSARCSICISVFWFFASPPLPRNFLIGCHRPIRSLTVVSLRRQVIKVAQGGLFSKTLRCEIVSRVYNSTGHFRWFSHPGSLSRWFSHLDQEKTSPLPAVVLDVTVIVL